MNDMRSNLMYIHLQRTRLRARHATVSDQCFLVIIHEEGQVGKKKQALIQ